MDLEQAKQILMTAKRDILEDKAFGDSEISWFQDNKIIADGYFSINNSSIRFLPPHSGTFEGKEAKELQRLGVPYKYARNDEQF